MNVFRTASITAVLVLAATAASAQQPGRGPGQGPVAQQCVEDIAKYCSDKEHANRAVRTCLEANKAKVSAACKTALDTTGGGRGRRQ
jgi:hypothetical protein